MCCLFTTLVLLGPRALIVLWWLVDPNRWAVAFSSAIWPILGFLFLPWTTLMWALVWVPSGISGFSWVWIALAFIADIASYSGGAYGNRKQIPGMSSSQ